MDVGEAGVDTVVVMDFEAEVGSSHGSDGRHHLALLVRLRVLGYVILSPKNRKPRTLNPEFEANI